MQSSLHHRSPSSLIANAGQRDLGAASHSHRDPAESDEALGLCPPFRLGLPITPFGAAVPPPCRRCQLPSAIPITWCQHHHPASRARSPVRVTPSQGPGIGTLASPRPPGAPLLLSVPGLGPGNGTFWLRVGSGMLDWGSARASFSFPSSPGRSRSPPRAPQDVRLFCLRLAC